MVGFIEGLENERSKVEHNDTGDKDERSSELGEDQIGLGHTWFF